MYKIYINSLYIKVNLLIGSSLKPLRNKSILCLKAREKIVCTQQTHTHRNTHTHGFQCYYRILNKGVNNGFSSVSKWCEPEFNIESLVVIHDKRCLFIQLLVVIFVKGEGVSICMYYYIREWLLNIKSPKYTTIISIDLENPLGLCIRTCVLVNTLLNCLT